MNADQPKDPLARIAELETELARVKYERDMYKSSIYDMMRGSEIDVALTEAEAEQLMNEPQGESLMSILEELEKQESGAP